jgi:hypothetical protein
MNRTKLTTVRLSVAEHDALQQAAGEMRRKTGELLTVSSLLRCAAADVAKQAGVSFPAAAVPSE